MKVALLAGDDLSLLNFRGELIRQLAGRGHEVFAFAPRRTADIAERLAKVGARFVETPLDPQGLNPLRDLAYRRGLEALYRQHAPDLLLAYTVKPVVHGCVAARAAGVPRVFALVTGLGAAFNTAGLKGRAFAFVVGRLYRAAFRKCSGVIVQNPDIERFFREGGFIPAHVPLTVVPGSGVNTAHFSATEMPAPPMRFLFLGRLLSDKGVREFGAAARVVKRAHPATEFWMVGRADRNPAALSAEELRALKQDGVVQHFEHVEDVRGFLRDCSALVLPSYHEGMPRAVLEAMATGRPIITTDAIGCRETIFQLDPASAGPQGSRRGSNGLLVPVRSVGALAEAMQFLIAHPTDAERMGREGRRLAESHFDVNLVNRRMLEAMSLNSAPPSVSPHS